MDDTYRHAAHVSIDTLQTKKVHGRIPGHLLTCNKVGAEYLVLNLSEQITWVSQIVGADYLGLQNAGAEYLGPFFAKSGADYLGGQITFLVGQNTWAPPKVGGRIPGRGQKWGRIPGRGQKWGRLPGMIFLVFRPALLPRCRITLVRLKSY